MCDSLGIEPKLNNGTLRLPLKPIGLHSDEPLSSEQDHPDLPADTSSIDPSTTGTNVPSLAEGPIGTNFQDDGAPASETQPVAPDETLIIIEAATPKGIQKQINFDIRFETDGSQTMDKPKRPKKS